MYFTIFITLSYLDLLLALRLWRRGTLRCWLYRHCCYWRFTNIHLLMLPMVSSHQLLPQLCQGKNIHFFVFVRIILLCSPFFFFFFFLTICVPKTWQKSSARSVSRDLRNGRKFKNRFKEK